MFFDDVRVPGRPARRRGEPGLELREVPARQRTRRRRAGRGHQACAGAGSRARRGRDRPALLDDPLFAARFVELENELLALELTAAAGRRALADGKPHPASSVLKLRAAELQQAVSELPSTSPGPRAAARRGADVASPSGPRWRHRPTSTPQGLDLRRSNEIQRQIIAGTILGL